MSSCGQATQLMEYTKPKIDVSMFLFTTSNECCFFFRKRDKYMYTKSEKDHFRVYKLQITKQVTDVVGTATSE